MFCDTFKTRLGDSSSVVKPWNILPASYRLVDALSICWRHVHSTEIAARILLSAVYIFSLTGVRSTLTKTPSNVVVEPGTDVTLECSSDASASSISWTHDSAPAANTPCTAISPRYITESTENDCYLTALGNYGVQGPYRCHDGSGIVAEAVAIVIGNLSQLENSYAYIISANFLY